MFNENVNNISGSKEEKLVNTEKFLKLMPN
jgi:hypothetical protein